MVQSTATVGTGTELRTQWAIAENDLITLTADIDLGRCAAGNSGEPVRSDSNNLDDAITIDGQGLYGIEQTCKGQRVLRDDAGGETVTLTGPHPLHRRELRGQRRRAPQRRTGRRRELERVGEQRLRQLQRKLGLGRRRTDRV